MNQVLFLLLLTVGQSATSLISLCPKSKAELLLDADLVVSSAASEVEFVPTFVVDTALKDVNVTCRHSSSFKIYDSQDNLLEEAKSSSVVWNMDSQSSLNEKLVECGDCKVKLYKGGIK